MKRAMITVCGDFGYKHWVSDMLLTALAELSQKLSKANIDVVYADSMDNAQMRDPLKGIETEANWANNQYMADYFFLFFWKCDATRDGCKGHDLFKMFALLRGLLKKHTRVYLIDVGAGEALTPKEKEILATPGCVCLRCVDIASLEIEKDLSV